MLKHPLLETFMHVKWHLTKRYFYVNFVFYSIFLACLTSLAGLQAAMLKCGGNSTVLCKINDTELQCTDSNTYNTTSFKIILYSCPNHSAQTSYYVLFAMTLIGTLAVGLRELLQAIFSWASYRRSRENFLEFLIVVGTLSYLIGMHINISVARHLAAWSVFLGWLEMTMLVGRFPSVGIYIYMSIHVMKTLLIFILVTTTFFYKIIICNTQGQSGIIPDCPW
jgi:hypothetical protein